MSLIIHAPNVHQGGGKTLLSALLRALPPDLHVELLCDARLPELRMSGNIQVARFASSIPGRWAAERRLRRLARKDDVVLCMTNVPPLFTLPSRTFLLLQNRFVCEPASLAAYSVAVQARVRVERFWLRRRLGNVSRLIVQTQSMRECALRYLHANPAVIAFADNAEAAAGSEAANPPHARRFLYPAFADPHKNHANLIEAWRLLHADGVGAELHLTVPRHASLAHHIARQAQREGLQIVNHGEVDPARMRELYGLADALIFPSMQESFGLPLVEARAAGLPIIAAERDYVRDVVEPAQTFDPASAVSIARAVKRFLLVPEPPAPIITAAAFVQRLVSGRV